METAEVLVQLLSNVNDLMNRVLALEKQVDELKNKTTVNSKVDEPISASYKVYQSRQTKDSQQYSFNGQIYGKGRLVLAVVKQYVTDNPNITADELETTFDGSLQGSIGVVRKLSELTKFSSDPQRRFFLNQGDIIKTVTEECTVCNQWSKFNINSFIDRAVELGYSINTL